jgi:hypothetical protein
MQEGTRRWTVLKKMTDPWDPGDVIPSVPHRKSKDISYYLSAFLFV